MMDSKKILVIYFSQSGQLRHILTSVVMPLQTAGHEVITKEIVPQPPFPFPWTSDEFFDSFPESYAGIPCNIDPMNISSKEEFDLVILGYSPWYLSPSIPTNAFLQSDEGRKLLKNKKVITVIGSRNMWLQAQEKVKKYLLGTDSELVGNIALRDRNPNLTSVITIIRWLLKGKQEKSRFFPRAGVSEEDIKNAAVFGELIKEALEEDNFDSLQDKLTTKGATAISPNYVLFERNGSRIFKIWANFILKKGSKGDRKRIRRVHFFKWYLIAVLFL
ncbi:MAG: hypothetical protein WCL06_07755, partial [Bacteroidota bacterium]